MNSTKYLEANSYHFLRNFSKNRRDGGISLLILRGQYYSDIETDKGKVQTNIPYKYRSKNPQLNTSKLNPSISKKDNIPRPSGIYTRNIWLL